MRINVCSLFRDSQHWFGYNINQVDRFFDQIKKQEDFLKKEVPDFSGFNIFAGEKDSKDNTRQVLEGYKKRSDNIEVFDTESSGSKVESTLDRVGNISKVANSLLNKSLEQKTNYTLWIESDLIIKRDDLVFELYKKLKSENSTAIVAPVIWCESSHEKWFYDTWGFVCDNGTVWRNRYPFNINYTLSNYRYLGMRSVGSCVLAKNSFISKNHFGTDAFRDFCKKTKEKGGKIYADKEVEIYHPTERYIQQRQI
tara:strand:+ start:247 stop:1008 length:762 start_codon:yes stop_codon:yes gene_type:complete